jgi:hypothetical protein
VQQLHLVGFTTDHKGLILGTRRGTQEGSFVVNLDRALVEQIEELLRLQAGEGGSGDSLAAANGASSILRRPKAESRLTPREVQSLLRTGRSVSEVAEAAAMSEDWVGRFAPPVLAEQARVVERATGLTYSKPRIGPSIQPLGESVVWNLAERGVILSGPAVDDAWSAFQQPDGIWVVRVSYLAERRRQHADWTVDMANGALKALNRLGNELGYVEQGRRRPQALPPATPVSASAQRAAAAPPKPTPPPPLPPRPTGRLSLLGASAGVTRQRSAPSGPGGAGRDSESAKTPRRPTPDEGSGGEAKSSRPVPGAPAPGAPAPRERRPRPLRPLSAGTSAADAGSPSDKPAPDKSAPPTATAAGGDDSEAAASPRPRRERPLRAPSKIRRDELADPPAAFPRRAATPPASVPPRDARSPVLPPGPSGPAEPVVNRFGPTHSAAERKVSTAERFGVGRSGQTALASQPAPERRPTPRRVAAVPDPLPDVDAEPEANNHAEPALERRLSTARPLRARRIAPGPDEDADAEFAPPFPRHNVPDADEVYQAFADLGADDPVTAPVAAVDVADQAGYFDAIEAIDGSDDAEGLDYSPNSEDTGEGLAGGGDQVRIRAGQAGSAGRSGSGGAARARSAGDDRQARAGRLKLRRRPQGSP